MRPRFAQGFTLAELLLSLGLLVTISSLALPNLSRYVQSNRQENLRHSLLSHLNAARTEAIALMQRIELCGSSNGEQCDHAWELGWLIRDPVANTALRFSRQQSSGRLRWAGAGQNSQTVVFQANGSTVASNGRFIFCAADGHVAWQLVINRQGRVRHSNGLETGQSDSELCR